MHSVHSKKISCDEEVYTKALWVRKMPDVILDQGYGPYTKCLNKLIRLTH